MADKPVTVTLKGGPCDGKTLTLQHGLPIMFPYMADGDTRISTATYRAETRWTAELS